jgi:hypothetical protein
MENMSRRGLEHSDWNNPMLQLTVTCLMAVIGLTFCLGLVAQMGRLASTVGVVWSVALLVGAWFARHSPRQIQMVQGAYMFGWQIAMLVSFFRR